MDLMLIVNFWFMNYHALLWNKTNPYTVKLNLNLKIEEPDNYKSVLIGIKTYLKAYKLAVSYSCLILLRPYRFLNNFGNGFDSDSRLHNTFKFMYTKYTQKEKFYYRQIQEAHQFQGSVNDMLLLVFIAVRFSVFVIYFIKYWFDDRLKMARIHRIMGADF